VAQLAAIGENLADSSARGGVASAICGVIVGWRHQLTRRRRRGMQSQIKQCLW